MNDDIFIGHRHTYGGFTVPYFLPLEELSRHAYVIGKSGTGKSTLLKLLIQGLIERGHGVGVFDPHGELAEWTLDAIPHSRLEDVVYLDFGDEEFAPSLNFVTDQVPEEARPRLASSLVSAFRHLWAASWGPRLEHILYHSLRVLIDCQNTSLVALPRLLTDDRYREWVVRQCRDPFVREFWEREYGAWDKRFRAEAIAPVLNKLGQLVAYPPVRQSLGQVKMKVDLRAILEGGKILVVNLAKGRLGEDASKLLGALLASALSAYAMERDARSGEEPRPFTLCMDEAHCFLSDAMATVLSEARKFGLRLVLANQLLGQHSPAMRDAILGNAGSIFAFRVSGEDGEVLSGNFGYPIGFADLPAFTAILRTANGTTQPLKLSITEPRLKQQRYRKAIVARSLEAFCGRRSDVDDKLKRWLDQESRD